MIILGIETSCDETALSIIEAKKSSGEKKIKVLADNVLSQIEIHREYGGVFPMMAKREHSKNLIPLLKKTLKESGFLESMAKNRESKKPLPKNHSDILKNVRMILEREPELQKQFMAFIPTVEKPPIDLIAVTAGPGLEPCLWAGINFAKALSAVWGAPVAPINHMEGHILVSLLKRNERPTNAESYKVAPIIFPALSILLSGGHTELVLMKDWLNYEVVGKTRDDALGEAFDKVARILGLPYPGGPQISALAEKARKLKLGIGNFSLPRPMMRSNDLDLSFSGLKTAVLYLVKKLPAPLDEKTKTAIALEFENAVTEVVISKAKTAIEKHGIKTLILGGGVVANKNIRSAFEKLARKNGNLPLHIPQANHATDNALMIAIAGFFHVSTGLKGKELEIIKANGGIKLGKLT